ncbi:DUF2080 family transposase-associated protein [Halococcus salsus]|uniref:DUF2080 family transposase-associated protein n=1 Tax=Halococcus salsus TaxID=2162894 RepID=UPI00135CCD06|nr:DUF2080 family transposase-associated protein [Halococcus salsus]
MDRHEIEGHEVVEKTVKPTGNGAHVYLPKSWVGATIKVVRASELDADSDE